MENNDRLKNSIKSKIAISQFKEENMAMKKSKKAFVKTIAVACACLAITSGIVFAKDIEKVVKNLFSNSSEAVTQAVENGYVQTIERDYVYDKEIGVKIDNLVLDESNLNISIKFECKKENIEYIRFNKFVILTDTGEKIFDNDQQYATDINDVYTASSMTWSNLPQKVSENTFDDSILFKMGERSKEKKELYFKIQSLDIVYKDGTREEVEGNWDNDVVITEEMRNSKTIKYKLLEKNEHLESVDATLHPTGLELELNLSEPLDPMEYALSEVNNRIGASIFYIKDKENFFEANDIQIGNNSCTKYIMSYDCISTFSNNIDKIEIYLEPWDCAITLIKEDN